MRKKIRGLLNKPLVKDNAVLFLGMLILNVFNFFFHFYMGRKLGPEQYAVLGASLSILYLMNIPLNTIQTGVARFAAMFGVENSLGKVHCLFSRSMRKLMVAGILGVAGFMLVSPLLADFLRMETKTLLILAPFLFFALLVPIPRGILQGLQRFPGLSMNLAAEGIFRFLAGVALVLWGYGVDGAVGAITVSYLIVLFLSLYPLRDVLRAPKKAISTKEMYGYGLPVLLMLLSLTLFYSVDIMLVKHYFADLDAGYYAAVSLLGKIIFFGSLSISQVMFPKAAELQEEGRASKPLVYKSLGIMMLVIIPFILLYFFLPGVIVGVLYGQAFMAVVPLLGWFGVFMSLMSLVYLLGFYFISIGKKKFLFVLAAFNLLEIIGIVSFHASLMQVIIVLVGVMLLLLAVLLLMLMMMKDGEGFLGKKSLQKKDGTIVNNHTRVQ